jgi:hypothetical protein
MRAQGREFKSPLRHFSRKPWSERFALVGRGFVARGRKPVTWGFVFVSDVGVEVPRPCQWDGEKT